MSDPALGLLMLALIVVVIMMGFATAFTLMGLGMFFGFFAYYRGGEAWADNHIFDLDNMLYGSLFMLCGAYTLAQNAHVRGDFLYSSMRPRTQATLDLVLYIVFFLPGIAALVYAGTFYAADSWRIAEHSNVTADGPPVYHFKSVIPIAGALILLQGVAEIVRCVVCLQTGEWPSRLKDVAEIDVIEEQLAHSEYVDEESRKLAIEGAQRIDEMARQRGMGGDVNT